jgi:5'-nucleotidase
LLTSTGFYGQAVSEINLTLKPSVGLVSASARTVPVIKNVSANTSTPLPAGFSAYDKDPTIDALVTRYTSLSTAAGQVVVGSVTGDIKRALLGNGTRDETNESALANVMADSS